MSQDVKNACTRYRTHFLYNITTTNSLADRGGGFSNIYRWYKRVGTIHALIHLLLCIVDGTMAGVSVCTALSYIIRLRIIIIITTIYHGSLVYVLYYSNRHSIPRVVYAFENRRPI